MNIVRKDIDALNATVTVQVSEKDYQEKVEKMLRDYRKKVNMPGFRPGMVPTGLVKKMYGKAILAKEINKLISDSLYNYIKENNISVLGDPMPSETEQKDVDFDNDKDFEFTFDLGIAPDLDATLDKKTKINYYKISLTDQMIEDQVKSYTGRFGSYEQVEEAQEKDVLKGNIVEMASPKKEKEDGIKVENAVLSPAYIKDDKQKKLFENAKIGDSIKFNPKKAFENESEIASLLKVKKEEVAAIDADFTITITGITRYKEAEIDQTLFDKVYGEGNVKSEEEFRNKIKESIENNLTADSDYKFSIDAREALVKRAEKAEFPDAFLKRWATATNKDLSAEKLEEEYPKMIEDLKWHLVKEKIAKANNIKMEFADLEAFAKKVAMSQFAQYGMSNVPDDILKGYVTDMLKDEKATRNMMDGAMNEKITEIIKSSVKLEEKEISIEDFHKLMETK